MVIGTTAIGLRCGKPSVIVPFFGDQVIMIPILLSMVATLMAVLDTLIL